MICCNTTRSIPLMGGIALIVCALASPACGQGLPPQPKPNSGPFGEIQNTLGIVLDRLEELGEKIDNPPPSTVTAL